MRIRPTWVVLILAVVICLGQFQTQVLSQSVKTSTTYSTQTLTVSVPLTVTRTRTDVVTVKMPPPPEVVVEFQYGRWFSMPDQVLSKIEMWGNITNRSEQSLWDVRLKFELGDSDKSEFFYHNVSILNPGEMKMFHFDHVVIDKEYQNQWIWVRYRGLDQYKTSIQTSTLLRTTVIVETSQSVGVATLTTVNTIVYTYTESAFTILLPAMTIIVIAVMIVVIAIVVLRKRQATGKASIQRQQNEE